MSEPAGIRVGRVFGFPIFIDPTMIVIVGALAAFNLRFGFDAFGRGLAFLGLLFGSVLWHELGHALAVRRLKLGESVIVLHGLGGVTRYKRTPEPREGLLVALAGPGIGLALAALLYPFAELAGGLLGWALGLAVTINVLLNLLNLLPMMPLDGGQVLRFALMRRMTLERALEITVYIGGTVLVATAIAVFALDLGGVFVWLILLLIAAEQVKLFRLARSS